MDIKSKASRYEYRVIWSAEDEAFVGRVAEWKLLAAHGDTAAEALQEIMFVVEQALELCVEQGNDKYPQPFADRKFSGKFQVRLTPDLHRSLVARAEEQGVSLNHFVSTALSRIAG